MYDLNCWVIQELLLNIIKTPQNLVLTGIIDSNFLLQADVIET